ncbi:MAG: iron ABC transporter permease, partial [Pseudomonadota bacterium]
MTTLWLSERRDRDTGAVGTWALCLATVLIAPIAVVSLSLFQSDNGTIAHLARTVLWDYVANSLLLTLGVAIGVLVIGTVTAWLVVMCRFPGARLFEWMLILPLAFPAYILAYAYTDLLSHPGFVQSTLRDLTGWGPRDYWFPQIRSLGGATMMFIFVLYPYVYLLARSAFLEQSASYTDASRSLGRSPLATFFLVTLPLARPAIVGGAALALMETLADYGTVAHFSVQTFTTGIYRAWYSLDDLIAASQLATMLLAMVLLLVLFERAERRRSRFQNAQTDRVNRPFHLKGWHGVAAFTACLVPVAIGFFIPVITLVHLHFVDGHDLFSRRYVDLIQNTVTIAGIAAGCTVVLGLAVAYAQRIENGWSTAT